MQSATADCSKANARIYALRAALEEIERLGAEYPERNTSDEMFRIANRALVDDDKVDNPEPISVADALEGLLLDF